MQRREHIGPQLREAPVGGVVQRISSRARRRELVQRLRDEREVGAVEYEPRAAESLRHGPRVACDDRHAVRERLDQRHAEALVHRHRQVRRPRGGTTRRAPADEIWPVKNTRARSSARDEQVERVAVALESLIRADENERRLGRMTALEQRESL